MLPFENYPGGGLISLKKPKGGYKGCRAGYCTYLMRLTGQTKCGFCDTSLVDTYESWVAMAVDHAIPVATGINLGISEEWLGDCCNLSMLCAACNTFHNRFEIGKYEQRPQTFEEFVVLRDRVFIERKTQVLILRAKEKEKYATAPWTVPIPDA